MEFSLETKCDPHKLFNFKAGFSIFDFCLCCRRIVKTRSKFLDSDRLSKCEKLSPKIEVFQSLRKTHETYVYIVNTKLYHEYNRLFPEREALILKSPIRV